ncbi:hypothetical protein EASAB2608_00547 [Streptomyces sp. EAS-AB2608]|nr:hypothetical protein EASAB2608_00547 [Streptomyces sp. EAS-AB2608]
MDADRRCSDESHRPASAGTRATAHAETVDQVPRLTERHGGEILGGPDEARHGPAAASSTGIGGARDARTGAARPRPCRASEALQKA